jgi:hypothetical protein
MFAPRGARSRFAQWEGRIVEAFNDRDQISRHRWSTLTAKHIFEDSLPTLLSSDTLGLLRGDDRGDESSLRLALLWNELVDKSVSSPTAILGLLDILNSRGKDAPEDILPFVHLITRGIDLAQRSMSPSEALRFLLTLSGKFPSQRPPIEVLNKLWEAFSEISETEPKASVAVILDSTLGKQTHAPIVTAGIGDGLARAKDSAEILRLASLLGPEDELRLLAYSRNWSEAVMLATEVATPEVWRDMLSIALRYPDDELRAKSRRNIVPLLKIPAHASLLSALLQDQNNDVLFSVIEQIRNATKFAIAEFDEPLWRAARGTEGLLGVRRAILSVSQDQIQTAFFLRPCAIMVAISSGCFLKRISRTPDGCRC